jgi:patched domain-containing protein
LGTLPLAFSTSDIFQTVFIAFLALVVLGVSHGLLLLPVILSFIGPEDHVVLSSASAKTTAANGSAKKKEETARGVVVAKAMPPKTIRPDHRLEEIHC